MNRAWLLAGLLVFGCKKPSTTAEAGAADAESAAVVVADAGVADSGHVPTPKELADEHRDSMVKLVDEGKYAEVCAGTPTVPASICAWVAAKAEGKAAFKPDGDVFRAFFGREHIKKVSGTIVGDGETKGEYEAIVYGYRRHCVLSTVTTEFTTKGGFSLWVQEQPELREVTVKSGDTEKWVELEENDLGKDFSDLAKTYGLEAEGTAKDLMKEIANFVPYSELKGQYSDAGPSAVATAATPTATSNTPTPTAATTAAAHPTSALAPTVDPARAKARADCMRTCIAACKDDSACEMGCSTKTCAK